MTWSMWVAVVVVVIAARQWWNRREFLKSSATVAAGVCAMRWGLAAAADIPLEFDGSKFQLKAAEPDPKHGGVVRMGVPVRPPHFDLHQSGTIFFLFDRVKKLGAGSAAAHPEEMLQALVTTLDLQRSGVGCDCRVDRELRSNPDSLA